MLSILNHKRNANQTKLRFHFIPLRIIAIKKKITNASKEVGKKELLLLVRIASTTAMMEICIEVLQDTKSYTP
jgi:hypothetical protein